LIARAPTQRLRPGDADDSLAVSLEQSLALDVILAGERVIVPGGAVGLDDEPAIRPAEVRDHATTVEHQWAVDIRRLQPGGSDEIQDDILEDGAGGCRARRHYTPDLRGPAPPAEAPERLDEIARAEQVEGGRLSNEPAERAVWKPRGEIEHGANRRRDENAAVVPNVATVHAPRAVEAEASIRARSRADQRDLQPPLLPLEEPPERRRGVVAEDGAWAGSQDRRKEPTLERNRRMPHGIDAAM
jgi:hypothetical protein